MKKFIYLFFTLVLLVLACQPSSAVPSSVSVNDGDPTGHSEYIKVNITCNSVIDPTVPNNPTYFSTALGWNAGSYHPKKGFYNLANRAYNEVMPDNPESLFGTFIPKVWTGPVSIDVHCHLKLTYDREAVDPTPSINDSNELFKDGIIKFTVPQNDKFRITTFSRDPLQLNLLDVAAQINKIIFVTKNGKVIDFDTVMSGRADQKTTIADTIFYPLELDVNEVFPLTLYTISISTRKHNISVAPTDNAKGTISPASDQQISQGEDTSFIVVANDGYRIARLLIDGKDVDVDSNFMFGYTFKQVEAPHSIEALFEEYHSTPAISADAALIATLVDVLETKEDREVAEFEGLGFVSGSQNINITGGTEDTVGGTFTADTDGFVQAVKLKVEYEEGAESRGLTLAVKPLDPANPFSADKKYYALLLNKKTNYYDLFPAALNAAGNLEVAVKPVGDYFSEGTIFVYSGTATDSGTPVTPDTPANPDSGPKSGGGCAAGVGALALLAALPLLRRRTGK